MSDFEDVGEFHRKFELDNILDNGAGPREVPADLMDFRIKFLEEELKEFKDAYAMGDEAGMADALIDITYIAMGTAHLRGHPWNALWAEVQRANMTKARAKKDASDSRRNSKWDVIKPPGWTAPDIEGVLHRHGFFDAPSEYHEFDCGAQFGDKPHMHPGAE